MHRRRAVDLTGHGVFVFEASGVSEVLLTLGFEPLVKGKTVKGHLALVETNPAEHAGVGREAEGTRKDELLLIDPVGLAVDDAVHLAVLGDLTLGVVEEQLHQEEIALSDEGHHVAVGAPEGLLLLVAVGERFERLVLDAVDIPFALARTAVNLLVPGLDEDVVPLG